MVLNIIWKKVTFEHPREQDLLSNMKSAWNKA